MALSVSIELVSSLARVTSVKSTKGLLVSDGHPDTKIGPGHLGPIKRDKNVKTKLPKLSELKCFRRVNWKKETKM